MHFILVTVGSMGDVLPMVSLAVRLKGRGHRVTMIVAPVYSSVVEQNGLECIPFCGRDEYSRATKDKAMFSSPYGLLFVTRHALSWNRVIFRTIVKLLDPGLVVVAVDRPNLWADLIARRQIGVPVVRVLIDLPAIPEKMPTAMIGKRVADRLLMRAQTAWASTAADAGIRAGKTQISRLFRSVRPFTPTIALWPAWITGGMGNFGVIPFGFMEQPTIRSTVEVSCEGVRRTARKRVIFIAGTEGTTAPWMQRFAEVSAGIVHNLDAEGIFLTGYASNDAAGFPRGIKAFPFVALKEILADAAAIVHHGGIGTAAAALSHSVPQLITPRVFLQPSNAE